MKIKVYPTSDASLNIKHPADGPLKASGSEWTYDGFTCRMLSDGAVTDQAPSSAAPAAPAAPAASPAPAASSTPAPAPAAASTGTQAPSVS